MEEIRLDRFNDLPGSRRYCDPEAEKQLRELIGNEFRAGAVRFLGSGDFHYYTKLICDTIPEPFDLLLFDHHPDMQKPVFEGVLSCGGWLRDLLETNLKLRHVTIIGIDPQLQGEAEGFHGRVTVFPEGSTVTPPAPSDLPLYISVDKDVFCSCAARTNWDQGSLDLPTFEKILGIFTAGRHILGLDICGELPLSEGGTAADAEVNNRTDRAIIHALTGDNIII